MDIKTALNISRLKTMNRNTPVRLVIHTELELSKLARALTGARCVVLEVRDLRDRAAKPGDQPSLGSDPKPSRGQWRCVTCGRVSDTPLCQMTELCHNEMQPVAEPAAEPKPKRTAAKKAQPTTIPTTAAPIKDTPAP